MIKARNVLSDEWRWIRLVEISDDKIREIYWLVIRAYNYAIDSSLYDVIDELFELRQILEEILEVNKIEKFV